MGTLWQFINQLFIVVMLDVIYGHRGLNQKDQIDVDLRRAIFIK